MTAGYARGWRQELRAAKILCLAIAGAALFVVVIALLITGAGSSPVLPGLAAGRTALAIGWVVLAALCALAAFKVRQAALDRVTGPGSMLRVRTGEVTPETLRHRLIVLWSVVNSPVVAGGIAFLLGGNGDVLIAAVVFLGAGLALSYPRERWFYAFRELNLS